MDGGTVEQSLEHPCGQGLCLWSMSYYDYGNQRRNRKPGANLLQSKNAPHTRVPMKSLNIAGQVYYCPVCGAEVSVIRAAEGKLTPHCCNQPMLLKSKLNSIYRCPVCGAEVMVTFSDQGELTPRCCNRFMQLTG